MSPVDAVATASWRARASSFTRHNLRIRCACPGSSSGSPGLAGVAATGRGRRPQAPGPPGLRPGGATRPVAPPAGRGLPRRGRGQPSPSHCLISAGALSEEKSPWSRIASAASRHRADRHPGEPTAEADPLATGLADVAHRQLRRASTLSGFDVASPPPGSPRRFQPGRVQHVGAGALVGLQTSDRVIEIRVSPNVVFGPRGKSERKPSRFAASQAAATRSTAWSIP